MVKSEKQTRSFEGGSGEVRSEVNSVSGKTKYEGEASARKVKCFFVVDIRSSLSSERETLQEV